MPRTPRHGSPVMSVATLLVSVEDLINMAMGTAEKNRVNYKMIQTILHILARQLRLLEQRVEIRDADDRDTWDSDRDDATRDMQSDRDSQDDRDDDATSDTYRDAHDGKGRRKSRSAGKAQGKDKETEKAEMAALEKGKKGHRAASKDKHKAESAASKDRDSPERAKKGAKDGKERARHREKDEDEKASGSPTGERKKKGKSTDRSPDKSKREHDDDTVSGRKGKKKGKTSSDTSIVISEIHRRKEKVLIVEKGPKAHSDKSRDSIEVVTRSQFDAMAAKVRELQQLVGPLPEPSLPDNKKLRSDLAAGSATLAETMEAMQVAARVQAAEAAVGRLGALLTALAAAGALPPGAVDQLAALQSVTAGLLAKQTKSRMAAGSTAASASVASTDPVTQFDLEDAIQSLKGELMNSISIMTAKATAAAENAAMSAKTLMERLDVALKLDSRITTLNALTSDYADQLTGFDSGLSTQMQSFREQITQMRGELGAGLDQLASVNNNAETAAVMELTERHGSLATQLDQTLHAHRALTAEQQQLAVELRSLIECIEMLKEQKSDRDEVIDGLRDKADISRLGGLLTAAEWALSRNHLEAELALCYDKFRSQEQVWMTALEDLSAAVSDKALVSQLLAARESAHALLEELRDRQDTLALILGEPEAAMLTRALARDATCGACAAPAHMLPRDKVYGAPPLLPPLRPSPGAGADAADADVCEGRWELPHPTDNRTHVCNRWVGGSHTLLSDAVTRERAPAMVLQQAPTHQYTGYGSDGRLYMLEEELKPCLECNKLIEPVVEDAPVPQQGAGDGDQGTHPPQDDKNN